MKPGKYRILMNVLMTMYQLSPDFYAVVYYGIFDS